MEVEKLALQEMDTKDLSKAGLRAARVVTAEKL